MLCIFAAAQIYGCRNMHKFDGHRTSLTCTAAEPLHTGAYHLKIINAAQCAITIGKSKMLNRITMTCSGCLYTTSDDTPAQKWSLAMQDYNARLTTDLFYVHMYYHFLHFYSRMCCYTHIAIHIRNCHAHLQVQKFGI